MPNLNISKNCFVALPPLFEGLAKSRLRGFFTSALKVLAKCEDVPSSILDALCSDCALKCPDARVKLNTAKIVPAIVESSWIKSGLDMEQLFVSLVNCLSHKNRDVV